MSLTNTEIIQSITTDQNTLTQMLKSLLTVGHKEATINLDPEGIYFRSMDKNHVSLIDIRLPETIFEKYDIKNKTQLSFYIKDFLNSIKSLDKKKTIKLELINDKIIISQKETTLEINQLNIADFNDIPLPRLLYDVMIKIQSKTLKEIIKKASNVSDYITIESLNSKIALDGKGDNGSYHEVIPKESFIELRMKEDSICTYSLEYLKEFSKSLNNNSIISFEYSTRKPCKLSNKINNLGQVDFYLAPRVEC